MWRLVVTPEGWQFLSLGGGGAGALGCQPGPSTGRDTARGSVMWGGGPLMVPQMVMVTPPPVTTVGIANVDGKSWI